jgi:hypothetical protein
MVREKELFMRKLPFPSARVAIPYNLAIDREGKVFDLIVGADADALEAVAKKLAKKQ